MLHRTKAVNIVGISRSDDVRATSTSLRKISDVLSIRREREREKIGCERSLCARPPSLAAALFLSLYFSLHSSLPFSLSLSLSFFLSISSPIFSDIYCAEGCTMINDVIEENVGITEIVVICVVINIWPYL